MTIRDLESRVEDLESGTTEAKAGDLSTWIAAMERDTDGGLVDEQQRLYRYGGTLYRLPEAVVGLLEDSP